MDLIPAVGCKRPNGKFWASKLNAFERHAAAMRVRKGESPAKVARSVGITPGALRHLCRVRGVKPLPNGRPKKKP